MGTEMYKTRMKYTMTSNGKVPHLSYKGIELPVSLNLDANIRYRADLYQQPNKTSDGKYIYALPGGGRYVC